MARVFKDHNNNSSSINNAAPAHGAIISKKIGIIGAGISGIAAAKQLRHHNPVVLEATNSIGGVWRHCSYASTRLQTPCRDYEFSDFPWPPAARTEYDNRKKLFSSSSSPSHVDDFPSSDEIVKYLHSYATHFDVLKFVKFNSTVVELRFVGDPGSADDYRPLLTSGKPAWEVAVQIDHSDTLQWYAFEMVVMCVGKYGDVPKIPVFPPKRGPEAFEGKVLHVLDYCKLDKPATTQLFSGNKVVVIGYKKSAIDLALECAEANQGPQGQACTMVVRTPHWIVPHYWIWGLPFSLFYSTRSSQFLHQRPNQGLLKAFLFFLLSPLRRAVSKFIESYLVWKLPLLKYGLKPDHPFVEDYASCQMAIMPHNFFTQAEKGKILFHRTHSKWGFWKGGVEFDDENHTKLDADVVVLATGYDGKKKLQSVLPEPFRSFLQHPSGLMPLYRGAIHPQIPNMSFVGYLESISNLHSAEMSCKWLARLVDGGFKLPGVEDMLEQTCREVKVMKRSTRFYKRYCNSTFSINHTDEICKDMGWNLWRKKNWFLEAFDPYTSQDYELES